MTTPVKPAWTEPQTRAITHAGGELLVSAAAGSGKTAVLAERCARLVCDPTSEADRCGVENLLVLTFTEAAANEMRTRIALAIQEKLRDPGRRAADDLRWLNRQAAMVERASISTLHAFCARVLRQHFHEARIDPAFEMLDDEEARLLREDILDDLLARWHTKPPEIAGAQSFADFLEAYANGREENLRSMILRVHNMLASTENPAQYLADARAVYSETGRHKTLDIFLRRTVSGELRLAHLAASRAADDAHRHLGDCPMHAALLGAAAAIQQARDHLESGNVAAARAALDYAWPKRLTTMDAGHFEQVKDRAYIKTKDRLKKLREETLAFDPERLLADLANLAPSLETLLALTRDFADTYTAAKRAQNRADFADLERLTLDLLTAPGSLAAAELRARYRHLLVDEFQDINPLQAALLSALRRDAETDPDSAPGFFVVGDVKQSIYGFRLAEPQLFLDRERAARQTQDAYLALPHNFRSQPALLAAMNALFEKLLTPEVAAIAYQDGHALQPPPTRKPPSTDPALLTGAPIEVHLLATKDSSDDEDDDSPTTQDSGFKTEEKQEDLSPAEHEARMVARRIAALLKENRTILQKDGTPRKLQLRDIAILLRAVKSKALIFSRALARENIQAHADLATGYFDTTEVRDTLALLHILDNPQQDIPLATALLGPYGRFTHDDLAVIRLTYHKKRVPFAQAAARYALGKPAADLSENPPPFSPELSEKLRVFYAKLATWREWLRTRPLHEGLADIYADAKILPYLAGLDTGTQRVANLHALHQRALKFAKFSKQGLHRFLRFIEKLRDQDGDFGEAPVLSEASNVVRIMSIHKSKGLEFPVVFVSGLGSRLLFNSAGPVFVHRGLNGEGGIGLYVADVDRNIYYPSAATENIRFESRRQELAEELRLLYVAFTRARDHLILTGHLDRADTLAEKRHAWQHHAGPLPEDALRKATKPLDWLLPTLACCNLKIQWHDAAQGSPDLVVTVHTPAAAPAEANPNAVPDPVLAAVRAGAPLPENITPPPALAPMLARLTSVYPHQRAAEEPAVRTVSQLKAILDARPEEPPALPLPAVTLQRFDSPDAEVARLRGSATHRILELLDFTALAATSLDEQIAALVAANLLTAEEADRADKKGIAWFLTTQSARRLAAAAASPDALLRREQSFTLALPLDIGSQDPRDWPTLRGVIDALIVHPAAKTAEILDYKTDSARIWKTRLPAYQIQMRHYLQAATHILGFPVNKATLLFLDAREEISVTAE